MVVYYYLAFFILCSLQHSFLVNDLQCLGFIYLLTKNVESLLCFFVEFEEHHLNVQPSALGTWSSRVKEDTFENEQEMRVLERMNKLRSYKKGKG